MTKGVVRTMAGHGGPVVSIEADDDKIVSSSFDGTLRVWNWDGHARATLPAHDGHSSGLALLGDVAFSGGDDGLVKRCGPTSAPSAAPAPASPAARLTRPNLTQKFRTRWDLRTETCTDAVEAHSGAVWSVRASEALLLSASTDCALKLWDLRAPVRITCATPPRGHLAPSTRARHRRAWFTTRRAHNDAVTGLRLTSASSSPRA